MVLASEDIHIFNPEGDLLKTWSLSDRGRYFESIFVNSQGLIYITTGRGNSVIVYDYDGNLIYLWDYQSVGANFNYALDISIDINGFIYISNAWSNNLFKFTSQGELLETYILSTNYFDIDNEFRIYTQTEGGIDVYTLGGSLILNIPGWNTSSIQLFGATDLFIDENYMFVIKRNSVLKFDHNGSWIQSWETLGSENEKIRNARGITVDNVFVYIADNHRIHKFTKTGQWIQSWGTHGSNAGELDHPIGIAVDDNFVYVADSGNYRIHKFTKTGQWIQSWGTHGSNAGELDYPQDIVVDVTYIYVVDSNYLSSNTRRIQKFTKDGTWIQSFGSYGFNEGQFALPRGIDIDLNGNVYVADESGWFNVHKFSSQGSFLGRWSSYGVQPGYMRSAVGIAIFPNVLVGVIEEDGIITIFRPMTVSHPHATISHLSSRYLAPSDVLIARGIGQDSDHTPEITGYRWISDKDGQLATTAVMTRSAATLSPGTHVLSLQVQDSEGLWSEAVSTSIYVDMTPDVAWTMLLYLAGDYADGRQLLRQFQTRLSVLYNSFTNPHVRIVVQLDGPESDDTRRFFLTPGTGNTSPTVTEVSIPEQTMDDPQALAAFLQWGQTAFPAPNYYLAIADHGQAAQGTAWDYTSDLQDDGVKNNSAYLTVHELGQALRMPGVAPVDIIHLDSCSMNLLEVAYELGGQVDYLISSQYLGWNFFAYDRYVDTMGAETQPQTVATAIASRYAQESELYGVPYTISVLNLERTLPTMQALDSLAAELRALINNDPLYRNQIYQVWQQSQRFESTGDYLIDEQDWYVDIVDWASRILVAISNPAVKAHAATLLTELTNTYGFIIASYQSSGNLPPGYAQAAYIDVSEAHGVSIFYPGAYRSSVFDAYINHTLFDFTQDTLWDEFLTAGIAPTPPGTLDPAPDPLTPLQHPTRLYLPFITR